MLRCLALLPSIQIVAGLQGLPLLESLLTPLTLFKLQNLEIWRFEGSESLLKVGQTTVSTLERILCPGLDLNPPGLQFTNSLRQIPHRLPTPPSTAWSCRQQRGKLGTCLVPRITPRTFTLTAQDLCTYCFSCLECFSSHKLVPSHFHVSDQTSQQEGLCGHTCLKQPCPPSL